MWGGDASLLLRLFSWLQESVRLYHQPIHTGPNRQGRTATFRNRDRMPVQRSSTRFATYAPPERVATRQRSRPKERHRLSQGRSLQISTLRRGKLPPRPPEVTSHKRPNPTTPPSASDPLSPLHGTRPRPGSRSLPPADLLTPPPTTPESAKKPPRNTPGSSATGNPSTPEPA